MEGVIIKAYGGFYFVRVAQIIYRCAIRGKIRRKQGHVLVGDRVRIKPVKEEEGVVEEIYPRQAKLVRPPIANVEQAVIVFSVKNPTPNLALLDRFLVQVQTSGISPVICFNKTDLITDEFGEIINTYIYTGYPILQVSAKTGLNIAKLRTVLKGKITVLAGPSGVGKSSLLNALQPGLELKTGDISHKLKRGKHTTRHVELIPLESGGLVADTPGFSSMNLPSMHREDLSAYFPEIKKYNLHCKFTSCLHHKEPQCAVKDAVQQGKLPSLRYQHYLELLTEVIEAERRY